MKNFLTPDSKQYSMLPDTLSNEIDVRDDTVPVDTSSGLHLATTELKILGSVHAPGEAYLTVNEVYGNLENDRAFSIAGSVHDAGHHELNIGKSGSIQMPPASDLPSPKGFASVMSDRYKNDTTEVYIDSLVIFDADMPALAKVLNNTGYDCYDEVELYGDVHSTGEIEITIDKVFILN